MPVKKFKTFEEAERDLWCFKPDKNYYKRIEKLFKNAKALYKIKYPKGVHKYKTIEEADKQLLEWKLDYIRKMKDKNAGK